MDKLLQWLGVGYNVAPYMLKNRTLVTVWGTTLKGGLRAPVETERQVYREAAALTT